MVVVTFPVTLFQTFLIHHFEGPNAEPILMIMLAAIHFLYLPVHTAGLIFLISKKISGERWHIKAGFLFGLTNWAKILLVNLTVLILFFLASFFFVPFFFRFLQTGAFGFIDFIGVIAGVMIWLLIYTRLSLAQFCITLEGMFPKEAMIRSNTISKPFTLQIMACLFFIGMPLILLEWSLPFLFENIGLNRYVNFIITATFLTVLKANVTILLFRFYDLATRANPHTIH